MPARYQLAVARVWGAMRAIQGNGHDLTGLSLVMSPETWDDLATSGQRAGSNPLFFGVRVVLEDMEHDVVLLRYEARLKI